MMVAELSRKGKFAFCIFMASVFCFSIPPAMAQTVQVYAQLNLPLTLPFGVRSGTYQAVQGPFNVSVYSQIRFYASISSGSSINVSIIATDSTGKKIYGLLDNFTLNAGTAAGSSTSREYDCPGDYVLVEFTSSQAGSDVNAAIYGR